MLVLLSKHYHEIVVHYSGAKLATASGDTTVKVWDFARAECEHTFTEHKHAGQ